MRAIADAHDGTVFAVSASGQGATVGLRIPADSSWNLSSAPDPAIVISPATAHSSRTSADTAPRVSNGEPAAAHDDGVRDDDGTHDDAVRDDLAHGASGEEACS